MKIRSWLYTLMLGSLMLGLGFESQAAFDNENPGTRAAGMGGAFCAIADSAEALMYNPAGLGQIVTGTLSFTHARLLTGLDDGILADNYLAYVRPISHVGAVGLSWSQRNLFDLYQEMNFTLGYGMPVDARGNILLGGAFKVLVTSYQDDLAINTNPYFEDSTSVVGVSGDLGVLVNPTDFLALGLSLCNLNQPNLALKSGSDSTLPLQIRLGSAVFFREYGMGVDVLKVAEYWRYAAGLEGWWANHLVGGRLGMAAGTFGLLEASAGFSLYLQQTQWAGQLDYAFVYPVGEFIGAGATHKMTLSLFFGEGLADEEHAQAKKTIEAAREAERQGRIRRALALFEQAAELEPDDETLAQDIERLDKQLRAASEAALIFKQAQAFERDDNLLNAAEAYRQVLKREPNHAEATKRLAEVEMQLQRMTQKQKDRQMEREQQAAREKQRLQAKQAARELQRAQSALQVAQRSARHRQMFPTKLKRLQGLSKEAQGRLQRGDYDAVEVMAQSILDEVDALDANLKRLEARSARPKAAAAVPPVGDIETEDIAPEPTPVPQAEEKPPASAHGYKQARGAYGRAVKLMLDIDQLNGKNYFPVDYQEFTRELKRIKGLLNQEEYTATVQSAEQMFPRLQKLKAACQEKEEARKAMPTHW